MARGSIALIGLLLVLTMALVLVIAFLVTNWFGDSLDGTLARYRQRLRPRVARSECIRS